MIVNLVGVTFGALVVIGLCFYVVGVFNQMVGCSREIDRAFANTEVSLTQRHDEIPRLVEICRGYMSHERQVLESVTELRGQFARCEDVDSKVATENDLTKNLSQVMAVAEAYPELKAQELFRGLSNRLTELEDQIADRRELFNATVTAYNILIESLPAAILARLFGRIRRPTLNPFSA